MTPYRILLATDGSPSAGHALSFVASLPLRARDEVIVASHPAYLFTPRARDAGLAGRLSESARRRAEADVANAVARLEAHGARARGLVCDGDDAADALIHAADESDASLIVVGSRGRGPWTSIVLGSVARALAILSPVPVLVVREHITPPQRALVATDGSTSSRAALRALASLPQAEGVEVELLHILPAHDWSNDTIDWTEIGERTEIEHGEDKAAMTMLEEQKRVLPAGVPARLRRERGHAGESILWRAAAMDADLIVIGARGLGAPRQFFFGSTAERVLTQTRANVLIAQPTADT